MFKLSPDSQAALDAFCESLGDNQARALRGAIDRVRADPSGRRNPQHHYTQKFRDPAKYLGRKLPKGTNVWEFKPSRYRALFLTDSESGNMVFLAVRGQRFFTADDCPWH